MGIVIALPELKMPAVTHFIDGTGPVFAGSLCSRSYLLPLPVVPFQVSMRWFLQGRHQNLLNNEVDIRMIGYGGMLDGVFCRGSWR